MSDANIRAAALAGALQYAAIHKIDGVATIVQVAQSFSNFLDATGETIEKPAKTKTVKVAEKIAAAQQNAVPEGPSKADVGSVVEKLLGANKRTEAVALMKEFGASSVSTLAEAKYAKFIEAAEAILMTA